MIVRAQAKGNKWQSVVLVLPGRTDSDIKNRWNSKLMHFVSRRQKATRSGKRSTPADSAAPTRPKATDDSFQPGGGEISDCVVGQMGVGRQGEAVLQTPKQTMFKKRRTYAAWTPSEDELLKSIVSSTFTSSAVIQWSVVSGLFSVVRMRAAFDCSCSGSTGRWCPR